jgi:iron complex outermembrane receptor protein
VLGQIGSANGGRDAPQPQNIIDNCAALGVPVGLAQRNPQLSAISAGNDRLTPETSDNYSFGIVYGQPTWSVSVDFYDLEIDNAVQGRDPGEVIAACVETLDPFFCDAVNRTGSGQVNLVDNQLQNIGGVEASGADVAVRWTSGTTGAGKFDVAMNATYLDEYTELTNNPDGSLTANDRTGTITNETFQRAFPEWKAMSTFDWRLERWMTGLTVRWVDEMIQDSGNALDSKAFVDLQGRYSFLFRDSDVEVVLGARNVLDEDPAVCDSCGVIGMAPIVHDLPGRVLYLRFEIDMD